MNGAYGKFALDSSREISEELTSNSDLILDMLNKGVLSSYKILEEIEDTKFY